MSCSKPSCSLRGQDIFVFSSVALVSKACEEVVLFWTSLNVLLPSLGSLQNLVFCLSSSKNMSFRCVCTSLVTVCFGLLCFFCTFIDYYRLDFHALFSKSVNSFAILCLGTSAVLASCSCLPVSIQRPFLFLRTSFNVTKIRRTEGCLYVNDKTVINDF